MGAVCVVDRFQHTECFSLVEDGHRQVTAGDEPAGLVRDFEVARIHRYVGHRPGFHTLVNPPGQVVKVPMEFKGSFRVLNRFVFSHDMLVT